VTDDDFAARHRRLVQEARELLAELDGLVESRPPGEDNDMGKREDDWHKNGSPFEKQMAKDQGKTVQELRERSREITRRNREGR